MGEVRSSDEVLLENYGAEDACKLEDVPIALERSLPVGEAVGQLVGQQESDGLGS